VISPGSMGRRVAASIDMGPREGKSPAPWHPAQLPEAGCTGTLRRALRDPSTEEEDMMDSETGGDRVDGVGLSCVEAI